MPISDCDGYSSGHFQRVYDHIIKPACTNTGFIPVRADEIMTTNYIALDIIKNIINSDMAICDLSGRNPNVLYELGIRQAFNKPVTLIKDKRTNRIFDIQGFRDMEYDDTLRIDAVQDAVDELSTIIKNTYQNTNEVNSLVSLLGIEPAKVTDKFKLSGETELVLNAISNIDKRLLSIEMRERTNDRVNFTSLALHDIVGDYMTREEMDMIKPEDRIFHDKFGHGIVKAIETLGKSDTYVVIFANGQEKRLSKKFVNFRCIA